MRSTPVRTARREDAGFTLIEVMVAMFITTIVMTALIYAVVTSLTTIQQARQRQTATALATQQLERLRAEPYDTVTQPNTTSPCDSVTTPYLANSGTTFNPPASLVPGGISEPLVVNCVSGKTTDQVVGNVTYHVQTYVTKAPVTDTSQQQPFNLTALVQWTSTVSRGQRQLVQRSTTFSPAGCLSTATSPFAAPCQEYFTVRAGEALSGLTVSSTSGPDQLIAGMADRQLQLDLSHTSANLLIEQTASGTSSAVTSGASVIGTGTTSTGGQSAGAAVDSDPSSTPNQSVSSTSPGHTDATLTTSGTGGTLSIAPSQSDQGAAAAAIQADSSMCVDSTGSTLSTGTPGRPCADAQLQTAGTAAALTYTAPSGTSFALATFGTAGAPSRAVAAILGAANPNVCSASAQVDCGHAAVSRSIGAASFGTGGSAPGGYDPSRGIWSTSGISESAWAEEGSGGRAPDASTYTRSGTINVWTGSGYQTIDLSTFSAPGTPVQQTWDIPATTVTYAGGISVTYEGSLTVQRPSITRTPSTRTGNLAQDCKTTACTTTVSGTGGISARVTVTISGAAGQLTQFATATDLGGLTANSSFKAAANA